MYEKIGIIKSLVGVEHIDVCRYNHFVDKIFKALADLNRRKIITLLKEKEMAVNELLKNFDIGQATLSSHLSILKKAKLVDCRVMGKQRIYRLNQELLVAFAENMRKFAGRMDQSFAEEIAIRGTRV